MFRSTMKLFVVALIAMAPIAKAGPPRSLEGWGDVVDPTGDCRINLVKEKLTIAVPGTKHDLSVETGDTTAPRVVKEIDGDFIAQVKVSGNVRFNGRGLSQRYLPYHGAGFLILVDDQTYLRFERAAISQPDGAGMHYANFELRQGGNRTASHALQMPDRDTYLRLERRGSRIIGSVSDNGLRWMPLEPIAAELPKRIKVGVVAVNTSTDPFKAEFSDGEIFLKETKATNPPKK